MGGPPPRLIVGSYVTVLRRDQGDAGGGRGIAEPEPVQEIAQPRPTGVDGHDAAPAPAAAAQQNVDLEHPPHQGRPGEASGPGRGTARGSGGEGRGAGPPPSAASRVDRGTTAARSWARGAVTFC